MTPATGVPLRLFDPGPPATRTRLQRIAQLQDVSTSTGTPITVLADADRHPDQERERAHAS